MDKVVQVVYRRVQDNALEGIPQGVLGNFVMADATFSEHGQRGKPFTAQPQEVFAVLKRGKRS